MAAIVIVFSILSRPNQEQLAEQQRLRDSIQQVERQRALDLELARTDGQPEQLRSASVADEFFNVVRQEPSIDETGSYETEYDQPEELHQDVLPEPVEEYVVLENNRIRLTLATRGGSIRSVQLLDYLRFNGEPLYLFKYEDESRFNIDIFNRQNIRLSTENELFTPIVSADGTTVIMRLQRTEEQYIDLIYTLPHDQYMMHFDVRVVGMRNDLHPESLQNFWMNWEQRVRQQEKGRMFENRFTRLHFKYHHQGVNRMSERRNEQFERPNPITWIAFKSQFFTSVMIADRPFINSELTSTLLDSDDYIKHFVAQTQAPVTMDADRDLISASFRHYFGPVHFNTLRAFDAGLAGDEQLRLQELVFLGHRWISWINRLFVIPLFDFFLSLGWGMGLIIFMLTLIIKVIVSPLTFKSFMSSAKMRVLRPQVQEIEAKYPGQDREMMMKRQQATMDLYNRAGANPMKGCLPMLIQMPILIAFFFFFPSAIELRQQSFLWANDLSTFDDLISWDAYIPLISRFLGNHISIFTLMMTVTNVLYMRHTMAATNTGQQQMPGMKHMPVIMSVFMFFFLNSFPSGLTYYYFLSTLMTVVIMFIFKKTVNEEKILAQLEANKNKPRKKSGFMARMAELQKQQELQAKERAKQAAKKRR